MARIICGCCKERHGSAVAVRDCYAVRRYEEAEAQAEYDADAAYERWLEDGGPHAAAIAAEHDADMLRGLTYY